MSFCSSEAHLCRSAETPFAVLGFERSARAFSSPETQVHMPQAVFLNVTDVTLSRCGVRVISLAPEVPARGSAYSSWCKVRNSHGEITNRNLRTKSTVVLQEHAMTQIKPQVTLTLAALAQGRSPALLVHLHTLSCGKQESK